MGTGVHQQLSHVHSCYPFRLFLLIDQPELGNTLAMEDDCLKDSWTISLQSKYPGLVSASGQLTAILKVQ
eukprot:6479023-Amphidinium_carterae.1